MKQQRRSVRQWIAGILHLQSHLDAAERKAIADKNFQSGYVLGIVHATGKPANASYRDYARALAEQASGASVQFLAPPPRIATYEPPDKRTDAIQIPPSPIWPIVQEAVQKPLLPTLESVTDTRNLQAMPGKLASKAYRHFHGNDEQGGE